MLRDPGDSAAGPSGGGAEAPLSFKTASMQTLIAMPALDAAQPRDLDENDREDASRYLLRLCKRLDQGYLRRRGIVFLIDVNGGWLPGPCCRTLGLLIAALVIDIVAHCRMASAQGEIAVSVHHRTAGWDGAVAYQGLNTIRSVPPCLPEIVWRLASDLHTDLDHRVTPEGASTAFLFEPGSVHRAAAMSACSA